MANPTWAVEYPVDLSAVSAGGRLPVAAKLLRSLQAALNDAPVDEWTFEVDGEPVEGYAQFQERLAAAAGVQEGEFVARARGIVVRSV
jgi:hypothetical protein